MATAGVGASRVIFCEAAPSRLASSRRDPSPRISPDGGKIVLQPRLCTLRSYGSAERAGSVVRTPPRGGSGGGGAPAAESSSTFFASLAEYIATTRDSHDFEIVSGRLAMIGFATAVSVEAVTGDTLFKKLDLQQIAEAGGVCLAVVASAAAFAWFSSARTRIRQMLTLSCNSVVDAVIDQLVDGLFYDTDRSDWSDEI